MRTRSRRLAAAAVLACVIITTGLASAYTRAVADTSDITVNVPSASGSSTPSITIRPPTVTSGTHHSSVSTGVTQPIPPETSQIPAPVPAPNPAAPGSTATTQQGCVPAEPAVPTTPAVTQDKAVVAGDVFRAGEPVTVAVEGFTASQKVQLVVFGDPALVATFRADESGKLEASFVLPAGTRPGRHVLQLTDWCHKVATADVLVGATPTALGEQGIPAWVWWVGGGVGIVMLGCGTWWFIGLLRTGQEASA